MKKTTKLAIVSLLACAGALASCTAKDQNKIVVGVTDYAPMDYLENEKWVGFDAELAEKVFSSLGYTVEFQEIDWDTKTVSLQSKTIDCIWNGMTVTDELKANVLLSDTYLTNQQYGLVKASDVSSYTKLDSLKGKKVVCESGSAAQDALEDAFPNNEIKLNPIGSQINAVMEVAAGTADIAVVDFTMAKTLTAAGSDYAGKLVAVDLGFEKEEFAIGFRKEDSKLCSDVNAKIKGYYSDGTVKELAKKYGVENLLIA